MYTTCVRLVPLLLVLAVGCAVAQAEPEAQPGRASRLTIVGINDTHGALLAARPPRRIARSTDGEIGGADWFGGDPQATPAGARARGGAGVVADRGGEIPGNL